MKFVWRSMPKSGGCCLSACKNISWFPPTEKRFWLLCLRTVESLVLLALLDVRVTLGSALPFNKLIDLQIGSHGGGTRDALAPATNTLIT